LPGNSSKYSPIQMAQRNDDCTPNACCGRSKDGHRIVSVNVIRQLLFEYVHGLIPSDSLQLCDGGLLDKIVSKGFITLEDMKKKWDGL
jgi:hypothetical protein